MDLELKLKGQRIDTVDERIGNRGNDGHKSKIAEQQDQFHT